MSLLEDLLELLSEILPEQPAPYIFLYPEHGGSSGFGGDLGDVTSDEAPPGALYLYNGGVLLVEPLEAVEVDL